MSRLILLPPWQATVSRPPAPQAEWYGKNATTSALIDSGGAYPLSGTQTITAGGAPNGEATWTPATLASRGDVCGLAAGAGRVYVAVAKTPNTTARQWLIGQGEAGSGNVYKIIEANSFAGAGKWGCYVVASQRDSNVATDTGWHVHLLAFDGGTGLAAGRIHYYVDGVETTLTPGLSGTMPDFATANFTAIGAYPVYGLLWQGQLAYGAIYPALTAGEIAALTAQLTTYFNL